MSAALDEWQKTRGKELDQVVDSHKAIGGHARGRRYATQQVNYAYATLLSAQFQGFCRDLHSEAARALVAATTPPSVAVVLSSLLTGPGQRKLDSGNPNPGNIQHDFGSLGIVAPKFWDRVKDFDARSKRRQEKLEELNSWRNAIAHQDWSKFRSRSLQLATVGAWRNACNELAKTFDRVVAEHVTRVIEKRPW